MPQSVETPIASVRPGGYQPGQEITVGGKTLQVIATDGNGEPVFKIKEGGTLEEDSPSSASSPAPVSVKAAANSKNLMAKIISKRDKIMELPDGVRETVLEKLFDKAVGVHIPKAMNDQQRQLIKQRFVDTFVGQNPTPDPGQSPEDRARAEGMPHGAFGVGRAGLLEGLSNMMRSIRHEGYKLHYGDKGSPEGFENYANKGVAFDLEKWFKKQAEDQRGYTAPYEQRSKPHNIPLIGPTTRADVEGGVGKTLSSLPLDLATAELIPGAKGAKLGAKILSGAGKGAVAGGVTAPSFGQKVTTGMEGGAAIGGVAPILGAPFKRGAAKAATKAVTEALPGVAENSQSELEKLAADKFKKPLSQLSPDEKIKLVNEWRDTSVAAAKDAKVAAKKNAAQTKVDAIAAKGAAKADERVKVRAAMDESKALQKKITEFVRTNKRAPTTDELVDLKKASPVSASPAPAPTTKAPAPDERGIKKPERRTFLRTEEKDVKEYYSYRFQQLRDEIKNAATPEDKTAAERRLAALSEVQKAHPTSMGDAHEFKVESPEAVKAVAAVADVSKVAPQVVKVPEGTSGLSPFQQTLSKKLDETTTKLASATDPKVASQLKKTVENIKAAMGGDMDAMKRLGDAERKAAERERSASQALTGEGAPAVTGSGKAGTAVSELVSSSSPNPEEAMLKAEEDFYNITDQLEAHGTQGKEVAKKLNAFWQKPPKGLTRQQVMELGEKALEKLKAGGQ